MYPETPEQPDLDEVIRRYISEAGDPGVQPRPEHIANLREHPMRPALAGLACPVLVCHDARRHSESRRATPACHDDLHGRVVSHNPDIASWNAQFSGDETQRVQ